MSIATAQTRRYLPMTPARFSPTARISIGSLGLLALVALGVWVFNFTGDARRFPLNEVEVLGTLDYTDRDELRDLVVQQTRNGFYRLDIDEIRKNVTRMPWVAEAHIRRVWPDRLSIDVVEHEPSARWNDDALISKKFEMFKPPQLAADSLQRAEWLAYFARFPQLEGAIGRHEAVLSNYRTMQVYLQPFGVGIDALLEDDRRSQTLILSNSVSVKLGPTSIEERIQRFVSIYRRLVEPLEGKAANFDMRYTNGFAMSNDEHRG